MRNVNLSCLFMCGFRDPHCFFPALSFAFGVGEESKFASSKISSSMSAQNVCCDVPAQHNLREYIWHFSLNVMYGCSRLGDGLRLHGNRSKITIDPPDCTSSCNPRSYAIVCYHTGNLALSSILRNFKWSLANGKLCSLFSSDQEKWLQYYVIQCVSPWVVLIHGLCTEHLSVIFRGIGSIIWSQDSTKRHLRRRTNQELISMLLGWIFVLRDSQGEIVYSVERVWILVEGRG